MEQSPQSFGLGWGREEASKYHEDMPTWEKKGGRKDSGRPGGWGTSSVEMESGSWPEGERPHEWTRVSGGAV